MSTASEETLEKKISYVFEDVKLLESALTHSSLQKKGCNNERLEFLGDRVLGLAVAALLYRAFPEEKEGELAKRHTALVQQKALVEVAGRLGLSLHLNVSQGEKKAGGLQKDTILADAVEALIGAIFIDGGYAPAAKFVTDFWQSMVQETAPPEDPKTALQEWAQAQGKPLPEYRVVSKSGSDHAPVFEIEVQVEGEGSARAKAPSKRQAEKDAALLMLQRQTEMENE